MKKRIVITGLGMIGDFGAGKEDFLDFIEGRKQKQETSDFNFDDYIDTTLLRRADQVSYFASVAAKIALEDASLLDSAGNQKAYKLGAIVGTVHGALEYTIEYHKALALDNPLIVSPSLFSNSVLNAAASCISNIFKIRDYTVTIPGYAGVHQAIKIATELINEGHIDVCLVGGVDINNDFLVDAYSSCMDDSTLIAQNFGGSGFLVLETLDSALKRQSNIYAEVLGIEITSADYKNLMKHKIFPIKNLNLQSLSCVFTSAFHDKDSEKREKLFLKDIDRKETAIISCNKIFGSTFAAAESFQIILAVIKLDNSYNKVLTNHSSLTGSNACLLIGKYNN
jgi:3-oxoacyl-[acyl-carrier-protein] synthase II